MLSWIKKHKVWASVIGVLILSAIVGPISDANAKRTGTVAAASSPTRAALPSPAPAASSPAPPSPTPARSTPATAPSTAATHLAPQSVRDKAAQILTAATTHYAQVFAQGQQIVGTTQYPDGDAGLAALQDPNSAASKFSAWRQSSKVEQDVNTYMDAFSQADSGFDASDEPASISTWRDDVGNVQSDIAQWVQTAVSYQIATASQTDLDAAAAKVQTDLKTAQVDITAVQAGR